MIQDVTFNFAPLQLTEICSKVALTSHHDNQIFFLRLRYSPELRVTVPSPGPPLYYHAPGDQCSLHQSASVTTNTSLGHLWAREEPYLRALSDKLCAGQHFM